MYGWMNEFIVKVCIYEYISKIERTNDRFKEKNEQINASIDEEMTSPLDKWNE